METIVLYHGSSQIVTEPEIRIAKFNKDFYFGFIVHCFRNRQKMGDKVYWCRISE